MFEIKRYTDNDKEEWNHFVEVSRQDTFLFNRNYMDYHHDRFTDFSLMFYRCDALYALLPANIDGDTLWSHEGLTYGGFITGENAKASDIIDMFTQLNEYLKSRGIHRVIYKPIPWIYQRQPAQEDLYAITYACHAKLCVRNLSVADKMSDPIKWRHDRHYNANKAFHSGIVVSQDNTALPDFWKVLDDNLKMTYNAKPVHTLREMQGLVAAFPNNIRLYVAKIEGKVIGGVVIYIYQKVVHTQYISATPEGKHLHAIDALIRTIMYEFQDKCEYFDFGTSNEDNGRVLNKTLIAQKEGFGARGVCYDWYEWQL